MIEIDTLAHVSLAQSPPFTLGPLQVRPATREVECAAFREVLEPRVMQVLVALHRADGAVVGRDALTQSCWEGRVVGEDAINRVIARLRRLAERCEGRAFGVETITKVGYRLVAGVPADLADPIEPEPEAEIAEATPALAPAPQRYRRMGWIVAGWALLAALAAAVFLTLRPGLAIDESLMADYQRAREATIAGTAQDANHAIALLQSVVERSPDYAPGWSALALAYLASLEFTPPDLVDGIAQRAEAAWKRALRLDPADPEGLVARYFMTTYGPDLAARERAQLEVMAAAPNQRAMMHARSGFLRNTGRLAEAVDFARAGAAADGRAARARSALARTLVAAGLIEEADHVLDEAMRLWPRHGSLFFTRIWTFFETGRPRQALALINDRATWPQGVPGEDIELLRFATAAMISGDRQDIATARRKFLDTVPRGVGYAKNAMLVLSSLGQMDDAFATADAIFFGEGVDIAPLLFSEVQGIYAGGPRRATQILFGPMARAMLQDQRFTALAQRLGLMEYWRTTGQRPDICREERPPPFCGGL